MTDFITRFAPSPTGHLHLGHAFSALTVFAAAQKAGGRFLLRIEDIDTIRCKPEFEEAIFEDLDWLGLEWEAPVRRQSEHFDAYRAGLERLKAMGVVYRCFKTRKEILEDIGRAPHHPGEGPEGVIYPGPAEPLSADAEAEKIAAGEPYAWRLSMAAVQQRLGDLSRLTFEETGEGPNGETGICAIQPDLIGDAILARKDIGTSYHLAVTLDDATQNISHVIRGQDLFFATTMHRILQALLDLPAAVYRHHDLLTGADGARFAKRDKAQTLRSLREAGAEAADIRQQLGFDW
ncbi:tRNA glutamyl-Q(34) synthetase GluQRS [Hyphobacterium sp.]|uniref:tRNA glutamyl-Q(34) synthetase GluQRS n=1 Tax=Hyphobacterium sp. TaxID=2004662 RepID=UPI0037499E5B